MPIFSKTNITFNFFNQPKSPAIPSSYAGQGFHSSIRLTEPLKETQGILFLYYHNDLLMSEIRFAQSLTSPTLPVSTDTVQTESFLRDLLDEKLAVNKFFRIL